MTLAIAELPTAAAGLTLTTADEPTGNLDSVTGGESLSSSSISAARMA